MPIWAQQTITILVSVLACSGFWSFIQRLMDKKSVQTKMLLGIAHDRIMYLGMRYIEKGFVTRDEYENLYTYLYVPYKKLGGNGACERVMEEVKRLPIKNS